MMIDIQLMYVNKQCENFVVYLQIMKGEDCRTLGL